MKLPQYTLKRMKRKTLAVQIEDNGNVIVKVPNWVSQRNIDKFVWEHQTWIKQKQALRADQAQPKQFINQETFLYLGETYPLEIITWSDLPLHFTGKNFQLTTASQPRGRQIFTTWYKQQAKTEFEQRLTQHAINMALNFQKWRLSNAKSRWGVCSHDGCLGLNWRLIMAKSQIIDYVIVHELCHLQHLNHSANFWSMVSQYMPDYKRHRHWLKHYGHTLNI